MEAGALRRELDESRDGAVRLRPRGGEEAVGHLALHNHAPVLDRRQAVEALDDDRRGDVVGQVGDELRRRRIERGEVELERVAEVEADIGGRRKMRLERTVDLDRVNEGYPLGEVAREDAPAWADLEHDVVRRELRQAADRAEDVSVDG